MTDECYRAKQWLTRVYVVAKRVEINERMLEVLKCKVDSATAVYENSGARGDREQAQKRREDALLDYIEQADKVDRSKNLMKKEARRVNRVIKKIDDEKIAYVMELRYVKLLAWADVVKVVNYSRAQVFRFHSEGLEKSAAILKDLYKW